MVSSLQLGLLRRLGAVTLSVQLVSAVKRTAPRPSLNTRLVALGALTLSASTATVRRPLPPSTAPQTNSATQWLGRSDIFYKFVIAIVGTIWAIYSFGIQRQSLLVQLKTQDDSLEHQRQVSHAQFAASMISSMSDDANVRRNLALAMLTSLSPKYAVNFLHVLADSQVPVSSSVIEHLEQQEVQHEFSQYLADARKWQDYEIPEQAARQYVNAWNFLPQRVTVHYQSDPTTRDGATVVNGDVIVSAIRAYRSGNAGVAAKLFASAFTDCR